MVVGIVIIAILTVGYVGLRFLGSQVLETLRGTIEFGTAGSTCIVSAPASSFSSGDSIYYAAHFARGVPIGEVVTQRLLQNGTEVAAVPRTFEVAGDCVEGTIAADALTPGHYDMEYAADVEVLAKGSSTSGHSQTPESAPLQDAGPGWVPFGI
jgi:hypothetical protein